MKKNLIYSCCFFLAVLFVPANKAMAQEILPEDALPMIVVPHQQTVSYGARTFHVGVQANVDYTYATDADWLVINPSVNGIYVSVKENYIAEERTANITFTSKDEKITQTLAVVQTKAEPTWPETSTTTIKPTKVTANTSYSSNNANKTIDGDYSTFWHSNYPGFDVSETNPATLEYTFTDVAEIDYVNYYPRQDGNRNGDFIKVNVYVMADGATTYSLYGTYNWSSSSTPKTINFTGGLINPTAIKFEVVSGSNNNASCAEMEFCIGSSADADEKYFADDLYTKLVDDFTDADFDDMENPVLKSLAYQIRNNNYETDYRVAEFKCFNSYNYYSNLWNAPGKYYDQVTGVTGINVEKGKYTVIVRDIPEDMSAQLKIVAWYTGEGGGPNTTTYGLRNGANVINYTYSYPGLAYICYYDENGTSSTRPPIRVHFINGDVQGYLSLDKTNAEMHQLTANAKNTAMDVYGNKVHSVWTANGLNKYCKASDGSSIGYRQYMNVLDSLIEWEHELLGFKKYNCLPDLRTMAYVNWTYYMFQGSFGVSFIYSQESRVLNCKTLMYNDEDAIWGLSHEWGHQHQMQPYFCWAGMSEITNNMNSYYNIMRMGYKNSRDASNWKTTAGIVLNDDVYKDGAHKSSYRRQAYLNRAQLNYNSYLMAVATAMSDSTIHAFSENPNLAVAFQELPSVDHSLGGFVKLFCYFYKQGYKDLPQDWYESLRQTNNENGSTIEKNTGLDKYELLNSAQNSSEAKWTQFKSAYPSSVWTKKNLVSPSKGWVGNSVPAILNYIRKVSRLTGYNLTPYFEKWGFIRPIAMYIGDYGNKWYIMTEEMLSEFKEDMEALGLKTCDDNMVKTITNIGDIYFSTPAIGN